MRSVKGNWWVEKCRVIGFAVLGLIILAGTAAGQADVQGQWSTLPYLMPINPIHVVLLYNGKILVVNGSGNCPASQSGCPSGPPFGPNNSSGALLLDLNAGQTTSLTVNWDMFCNAMIGMADGRAFINGGNLAYDPFLGSKKSSIFDPATNTFTDVQDMAHGRWYPTATMLPDGRIMTYSGSDNLTGATNNNVEIYTPGQGWSPEYNSGWVPPLYPRQHLLPNGNVFYSGPSNASFMFNVANHTWTQMSGKNYAGTRTYGSSVLLPLTPANGYRPKVFVLGGSSPATATTEVIDLGASNPAWQWGPDMSQPRIEMNAVLLPTGKVLGLGGSYNDEDATTASLNADLYDPAANSFSSAGSNSYPRLYHSVALLLPDATIWVAGGNPQRGQYEHHMEIYKPAYLFTRDSNHNVVAAAQPTITSAPSAISWGNTFTVTSPDAANIASISLMHLGASTHSFDMDQRMVGLAFSAGSGTLSVTAPPNSNIAPPGYYMLFLINSSGVPSVAKMVRMGGTAANPAPAVSSISPNAGTSVGGTPVTITGTGFLAGATVMFGGTSASDATVVNGTTITATTPAHSAGSVNVAVTNSDTQSGTLANGYTFTGSAVGGGPVSFIQLNSATPANNTASVSAVFPVAETAGNLNIVAVGWSDATSAVSSVTDSRGNAYSLAIGPTSGTGLRQSIYYAKNIAAGNDTITVQFSQAVPFADLRILEYSGLDLSSPLDTTSGSSGNGSSANSGSATTTTPIDLIFAAGTTGGNFISAGTGFTARVITTPDANIAEDALATTTSTFSATANLGYSTDWVMQMATFRAAGQGPPVNPAPTVTSISPLSGTTAGGTAVTITGTGFLTGASVTIAGSAATNVSVTSSSSITATTPAHAAGVVAVTVTNTDGKSSTLNNAFTYTAANQPPTISVISPTSGSPAGGTAVTITGSNFSTGATVTFDGVPATDPNVVYSSVITAVTPAHAAGRVNVVVRNSNGQTATLPQGFTYTTASGVGPITFVQANAAVPPNPATAVTVSYPLPQTAGNLNIVAVGWNDTTSNIVSVTDTHGTNYALAIGPTSGSGIRQSIYYARNIPDGTNSVTVRFSQAAPTVDVRVLEYSGLDQSNPLDATAGAAGVSATSNSGNVQSTSANELIFAAGTTTGSFLSAGDGFSSRIITYPDADIAQDATASAVGTYNATANLAAPVAWVMQVATFRGIGESGPTYPAPVVSSISPNIGPTSGGFQVNISGVNFRSGAQVLMGGTVATSVTVINSGSISAMSPGHGVGAVNVTVSNTDNQSTTLSNAYTYVVNNTVSVTPISKLPQRRLPSISLAPATISGSVRGAAESTTLAGSISYIGVTPAVTTIWPKAGTPEGGTEMTIIGSGFVDGTTVMVGEEAATNVVVDDATRIRVTTPAHQEGTVDILVTNVDGQESRVERGFTYRKKKPTNTAETKPKKPAVGRQ